MMLERDIQSKVVAYARHELGIMCCKLATRSQRSFPDFVLFIHGGKPLLIEFKRAGEVSTKQQAAIQEDLINEGYNVQVCDSIIGAKIAILTACGETGHYDADFLQSEFTRYKAALVGAGPVHAGRRKVAGAASARRNPARSRDAENIDNARRVLRAVKARLR